MLGSNYKLGVEFTGQGASLINQMGQVSHGMTQVHNTSMQGAKGVGIFNKQMMALGTTMRFALAGAGIFAAVRQIQKLSEFQVRMGEFATIAQAGTDKHGNAIYFDRGQVKEVADGIIDASTRAIAPVDELGASIRNIVSSLADVTPDQVTELVENFAKGSRVAEDASLSFGNAIIGLATTFGRSLEEMGNIADQYFQVISQSVGMSGPEWALASGQVSSGAKLAGISMEEMNAMMVIQTRAGGSASTNARHLRQLFMRLRTAKDAQLDAWAEIGYDPKKLAATPGLDLVLDIFKHVDKLGGVNKKAAGDLTRMTDSELEFYESMGDKEGVKAALKNTGVSGEGARFMARITGRIEGLRALVSQYTGWAGRPDEGISSFEQLLRDMTKEQPPWTDINEAFERFEAEVPLRRFSNTMSNLFLKVARETEGALNPVLNQLSDYAKKEYADKAILGTIGGLAMLPILRRLPGLKQIPKFGIGGTLAATSAISNFQSGIPGADPTNPMFVWVLNSTGKGIPGAVAPVPEAGGKVAKKSRMSRLGTAAKFAGPLAAGYFAADAIDNLWGEEITNAIAGGTIEQRKAKQKEALDKRNEARRQMSYDKEASARERYELMHPRPTYTDDPARNKLLDRAYEQGFINSQIPTVTSAVPYDKDARAVNQQMTKMRQDLHEVATPMNNGSTNEAVVEIGLTEEAKKNLDVRVDGVPVEQWSRISSNKSNETSRGRNKGPGG